MAPMTAPLTTPGSNTKILVVDDEPAIVDDKDLRVLSLIHI